MDVNDSAVQINNIHEQQQQQQQILSHSDHKPNQTERNEMKKTNKRSTLMLLRMN